MSWTSTISMLRSVLGGLVLCGCRTEQAAVSLWEHSTMLQDDGRAASLTAKNNKMESDEGVSKYLHHLILNPTRWMGWLCVLWLYTEWHNRVNVRGLKFNYISWNKDFYNDNIIYYNIYNIIFQNFYWFFGWLTQMGQSGSISKTKHCSD